MTPLLQGGPVPYRPQTPSDVRLMPPRETEAAFFCPFHKQIHSILSQQPWDAFPQKRQKAPGISRGQFYEFYSAFSLQWAA